MTKYGYARVSTRDQSTDHQVDALAAAGVAEENMFIEKVSGKLASRPKLDIMLEQLAPGDEVVVTRLKRIGRSQAHLLELVRWFGAHQVDFVVLEQGIDTATPGGRLVFHFLAALAEYDREMIVEGTMDGLAAARARGRVGGRPPALSARQLDQAQVMYDSGEHTVEEIAETFKVGRTTLYNALHAYKDGGDCVLVVYRNTRTRKVDPDTHRRFGETRAGEDAQLEADRKWFPIGATRRGRLKAIVYVVDGVVTRLRAVDPNGRWVSDDRGYMEVPVGAPLTEVQIAKQLPTLTIALGEPRPHVRGKIREYVSL